MERSRVPTYCYQCQDCGHTFEITHKVGQKVEHCPECLGPNGVKRLLYAVAGWLKGGPTC